MKFPLGSNPSSRMERQQQSEGKVSVKKKEKKVEKKQGYTDRKDESIAMRVKKKRTPAQLKASADESYGKFGSAAKKRGKINV
jgi:hypothetical protein|tara:strand:- start:6381 stop:6629 length:249 start_codon:yes stop_codon:yes gene_type:complete